MNILTILLTSCLSHFVIDKALKTDLNLWLIKPLQFLQANKQTSHKHYVVGRRVCSNTFRSPLKLFSFQNLMSFFSIVKRPVVIKYV